MKKICVFLIFLLSMQTGFAQDAGIDNMLAKFAAEKNENSRIDIFYNSTVQIGESNPVLGLKYAQSLLEYSQKNNDKIGEAYARSFMGKMYCVSGKIEKGLENGINGKAIAEQTGSDKLLAISNSMLGLIYTNLFDYSKAISFYQASIQSAEKANYPEAKVWGFQRLSEIYLAKGQVDSALKYGQKDYELSQRIKYFDFASYTLINLAAIHAKLGNSALALSYYDMAIQQAHITNSAKQFNFAYTLKAEYLHSKGNIDTTIAYAKKAINVVQYTPFSNYSLKPAKILLDVYKNINSDSALKYAEIYMKANDSLYNSTVIQHTQFISFEEGQRQKELAASKLKAEEDRKTTIQYALIALSIFVLVTLYLFLSRRFIINPNLIEFFGVIALLLVFEFLNLLLHPFLGRITHHSPLLMLLGLVCIGALLVPLHHKFEKLLTSRLEKNKQMRLAVTTKNIQGKI